MEEKTLMTRYYLFVSLFTIVAVSIILRIIYIQFSEGDKYKELAAKTTIKKFDITPRRGDLYADDGSLLSTSITRYDIRFDTKTVSEHYYKDYLNILCDSLSVLLGSNADYYLRKISRARAENNRYLLIAKKLSYSQYVRIKHFPIFRQGAFKGGLIVEQNTVREHPLSEKGIRTIGKNGVGLEEAYKKYLSGHKGKQLKQRIAKGQWKQISDKNQVEPKDGLDVVTTININMQDIAHKALLRQLEKFDADHGSAVVMNVATGEVKAISNLGKTNSLNGGYYEKLNFAVGESHEPGSTFKLMSLVAALEDHVVNPSTIIDTKKGVKKFYDNYVRDSHRGGYGKISVSKSFAVSSNVAFAKIIFEHYQKSPAKFVNHLYKMGLNDKLGLSIMGEGTPYIPHPNNEKRWYGTTLPWIAHGYGVSLTPIQTLAFYNAVINDGLLIKPRFIKKVKKSDRVIKDYTQQISSVRICSNKTSREAKQMMCNVINKKYGTGYRLRSNKVLLAGKTGTCQKNYGIRNRNNIQYISSFVGYFPADKPIYSCIVVIHEPNKKIGYYGADVAGPVFKEIAEKVYLSIPDKFEIVRINKSDKKNLKNYKHYYHLAQKYQTVMPNLKNMSAMDAIALLENMGLRVNIIGIGKVKKQSIIPGSQIRKHQSVTLSLL